MPIGRCGSRRHRDLGVDLTKKTFVSFLPEVDAAAYWGIGWYGDNEAQMWNIMISRCFMTLNSLDRSQSASTNLPDLSVVL